MPASWLGKGNAAHYENQCLHCCYSGHDYGYRSLLRITGGVSSRYFEIRSKIWLNEILRYAASELWRNRPPDRSHLIYGGQVGQAEANTSLTVWKPQRRMVFRIDVPDHDPPRRV